MRLKFSLRTKILSALLMLFTSVSFSLKGATFVGDREDFRDETVYFVMTTRFYDGDPKNNVLCWDNQQSQISTKDPCWRGDFKGLIEKLDYIKALGFTAIWITPVVQNGSGYDYHGYHAMDLSKVDLRYESHVAQGSDEDVTFQSLIDAAHAKGMKIILDIVLNHTGNFGESHLCKLFDRDPKIQNQATAESALIPDYSKLGADYPTVEPGMQYQRRLQWLKNTNGQNLDNHNYWHHIGTSWNWDDPSRWWGQIAGDCVDLNTENQAVSDYLVGCYGKFIEMGVDGFRIDTTGHISRLTFNKSFIPQFLAIAEANKDKRLNGCPFYMFGECCARFSEVTYRGQANLSSYFYTWKSPQNLLDAWNTDPTWWDNQVLMEGCEPEGNMKLCLQEPNEMPTSDNVFMKNGAWHEPDYSQASGFNIIDFPMHYNFNNAGAAVNIAKSGDQLYNDASFNLVYVDSHDYGPQPNDGVRFTGGTSQWAENLSLMFTFRGIPCIYYGSEVEFMKGAKIDNGANGPLSQTGRAYFGEYVKGEVTATDFGEYTASGNVATTLNGDLAQHIQRLNKIRAAVPALRKGQYTFDGCTANGGWAFKRAYKDSYALVAINGGATFDDVPAGNYVDIVTGQKYSPSNGSITVSAPKTQGQLRVIVKDWNGGKVGEDGQFIYTTTPVAKGGQPSFTDPGADFWYGPEDVISNPEVTLSPAGGSFKSETLTIEATLNESSASGWIEVGDAARKALTPGNTESFTIGSDMQYGDRIEVRWGASDAEGTEYTGNATYKKVDPNATITIYVTGPQAPNFYAWYVDDSGRSVEANGAWPGKQLTESKEIDGREFYYFTFADGESANFIFNNGSAQTDDITGVTEDSYYEWDGGSGYTQLFDVTDTPEPGVRVSPNGGEFIGTVEVTLTANNNTESAWYKIGDSEQVPFTETATFVLGEDMQNGESVTVSWSATGETGTKTGEATFTKVAALSKTTVTFYFDNSISNWSAVNAYIYSDADEEIIGGWPGQPMVYNEETGYYVYSFETDLDYKQLNVIFNNGAGAQTADNVKIRNNGVYNVNGFVDLSGVDYIYSDKNAEPEYYNLQGIRINRPEHGIFIEKVGAKVRKVVIP